MKKFLLIDDHLVVRSGIKGLLAELFNDQEIHEAADANSALEELKLRKFDMVLMDVQIPGCDMLGLMEYVHIKYPETRVLIFSMSAENIYAKRFLKAGARGFLPKDSSFDELKKAIGLVLNDKLYVSEALAQNLADEVTSDTLGNPFNKLSTREFEIATMILSGQKMCDLGKSLNLHPSSVATYKKRIFEKLDVKNVIELNQLAVNYQFIVTPPRL